MEKEMQNDPAAILSETARTTAGSFELLITDLYPGIVRYLTRMTDDPAVAEDLAQDTFSRVYSVSEKLSEIENPKAWIYRIATNNALQYRRRKKLIAFIHFERLNDPERSIPSNNRETDSENLAVREALKKVPDRQRTCLILHYIEGFKYREIAETLNISEEAVRKRIARGKESFQEMYNGGMDDEV